MSDEQYGEESWEMLQEESAEGFKFENIGDQLVGVYRSIEHIEPEEGEPFDRVVLDTDEGPVAIPTSYSVMRAIGKAEPGDRLRITYIRDIQTSRGLNPMKDFRVEVQRANF